MKQSLYKLEVIVHGHAIREYAHGDSVWVEGRKGSEFSLRIANSGPTRILAVVTVDGLSIMDGKPGDVNGRGYIIGARDAITIPGWRLNNADIAKFMFESAPEAYAAQMGNPANIGVIGCAVFTEKMRPITVTNTTTIYRDRPNPWKYDPEWPSAPRLWFGTDTGPQTFSMGSNVTRSASPRASAMSVQASNAVQCSGTMNDVGVGFGRQESHNVTQVSFDRAHSTPDAMLTIRYGSRDRLKTEGIDIHAKRRPVLIAETNPAGAQPFSNGTGCRPPAGWQG